MSNFDDKNLFDDDFDLLSESADSLFGQSVNNTPKKEEIIEEKNTEKNIKEPAEQAEEKQNKKVEDSNKKDTENKTKKSDTKETKNTAESPAKTSKKKTSKKEDLSNEENSEKVETEKLAEAETIEETDLDSESSYLNNEEDAFVQDAQPQQEDNQDEPITYEENAKVEGDSSDADLGQQEKHEKPKKEKAKKERVKKEKKKRKPLTKLQIILICASTFVVLMVGVWLGLYIKFINTKLETPVYQVYQRSNGTIIDITNVNNATGYEITLNNVGDDSCAVFVSNTNKLELKSYLNKAGKFTIKVRALGKTAKATSDYSEEKNIENHLVIDTPNIFRDGNVISWNPVDKAINYRLYYKANLDDDKIEYIELAQNSSLISYDLTLLNEFGPGYYPVCVQAITNVDYYLNSNYSNICEYEYYAKLQNPIKPTYNKTTKALTFLLLDSIYKPTKYVLSLGVEKDGGYTLVRYIVLLNELQSTQTTYNSAKATKYYASLNELIVGNVENVTFTAISDSKYSYNSDVINVVVE